MNVEQEYLSEQLRRRQPKAAYLKLCEDSSLWPALKTLCLSDEAQLNWRAAWILSSMEKIEIRSIFPSAKALIRKLEAPGKDGYYREVMRVIELLDLSEKEDGLLYKAAQKLFENISLSPSCRIWALRSMCTIGRKYPALNQEIALYHEEHYLQGVSPGILKQMQVVFKELV
jgi:hypothetical protein